MKNGKDATSKELLIRIDERQHKIQSDLGDIKASLKDKVDSKDFKELKGEVNTNTNFRNRAIGYATGAGALAAVAFELINKWI